MHNPMLLWSKLMEWRVYWADVRRSWSRWRHTTRVHGTICVGTSQHSLLL